MGGHEKVQAGLFAAIDGDKKDVRIAALNCFAGIGTGAVFLKRLEVKIKTVVHVEHDKIATHTHQQNHDPTHNKDPQDDGICHVHVEKFQDLDGWDESKDLELKHRHLEAS